MSDVVTTYGVIHRVDGVCKDDYENLRVYNQPPEGGAPIILQQPAMKSFKAAEAAYGERKWRPFMHMPKRIVGPSRTFRPIHLTGSIRSCATQARLYASDKSRYAPPWVGVHPHGLAIDVDTGYLNRIIRNILLNHGWRQSRPDDEPWHFSFGVIA